MNQKQVERYDGAGGFTPRDAPMKQKCLEVMERAYLFLDGEGLTIEERVEIETHLADCGPCLERVGVERETIALITSRLRGSAHCPDRLKERIATLLDQA